MTHVTSKLAQVAAILTYSLFGSFLVHISAETLTILSVVFRSFFQFFQKTTENSQIRPQPLPFTF
jgi:hypothetical protein